MDCLPTTPLQRKTLRKTSTGRNLTQKWQLKNQLHQCVQTLFSSGLYRRRRNFTCSAMAKPLFIGCTIGVELHHAPKILFCCGLHYTTQQRTLQGFCSGLRKNTANFPQLHTTLRHKHLHEPLHLKSIAKKIWSNHLLRNINNCAPQQLHLTVQTPSSHCLHFLSLLRIACQQNCCI